MPNRSDIDCVVFDWGGVILRICRTFEEGCKAAGLPYHERVLAPELIETRRSLTKLHQTGAIESREFYQRASDATGNAYSPEDIRLLHDSWLLHEYEGVAALIEELNALEHVTTGLLSNTNPAHWSRRSPDPSGTLPHYPTITKLEHAHASHLLGQAKPDAAIYHEFEREFRAATGETPRVLFFDDLAENVESARAAGWMSEQVDHDGDTAQQMREFLAAHGVLSIDQA